jgi:hypothetical protein|nr:SGNH/GDSL hydrolase family protein [Acidisphaera sp. L21]
MASPLLAGLAILMLGDSHFASQGYLVTTLQDALIAQGASVVTEAACGAPTGVWGTSGSAPCGSAERVQSGPVRKDNSNQAHAVALPDLVAKYHPNLIIIGSGDTIAGYAQPTLPAQWIGEQIQQVTARIQEANLPCIWIGPGWGEEGGPYFKNYARVRQVNTYLAAHVAPCRYIDSTTFAQPGEWKTFDGQHYTLPAYQKWGLDVDQAIVSMVHTK